MSKSKAFSQKTIINNWGIKIMTEISEVLAALKRTNLVVDEISQELDNTLKLIKNGLNDLQNPVDGLIEFEKRQTEEIGKYESGNLTLSKEITSLKEETASNETLLRETENDLTNTTDKRVKLETKKRETTTELTSTKNKLESTKIELTKETDNYNKLLAEVTQLIESTDNKIHTLEKGAEEKRDRIQRSQGERMALEYLIKYKHIEFNEIKIINSLDGRKTTDMSTISKVTGLSEGLITKTLEGLMKRNLLTFDNSTGIITVTGNLRI
ncbi:MAG: hypothetical protein ACTSO7_10590 [Candidatus Heimdallarchaeota archaeon]